MASRAARLNLGGEPKRATIYGQNITDSDLKRDVAKFKIAASLGLNEYIQALAGSAAEPAAGHGEFRLEFVRLPA